MSCPRDSWWLCWFSDIAFKYCRALLIISYHMLLQFSGSVKQGFNALGLRHSIAFHCTAQRRVWCTSIRSVAPLHIALYTAAHWCSAWSNASLYICAILQHWTLHIGCALATAQKKQCTDTAQEAVPAYCTSKVHLIVSQTANLKFCTDVVQEAMRRASKGTFEHGSL